MKKISHFAKLRIEMTRMMNPQVISTVGRDLIPEV